MRAGPGFTVARNGAGRSTISLLPGTRNGATFPIPPVTCTGYCVGQTNVALVDGTDAAGNGSATSTARTDANSSTGATSDHPFFTVVRSP